MRKGIAVFLTLSLLLALVAPLPKAEAAAQTEREAYIQRVLPGFLGAAGITDGNVRYTDEIGIEDAEDETAALTFVFAGDHLVGYLNVFNYDNCFHSIFKTITCEGIEQIIRNGDPLFLKLVENDVLLVSENEIIALYNRQTERYNGPMANSESNSYSMNILHETEGDRSMRISGSVNVPTVSTNSFYLTWAACVASVVNYYNSTSYSAVGLHNSLNNAYGGSPSCSDLWIGRGYTHLGGFNCYHYASTDFETLQEEIGIYHRPVLLQFSFDNVVVCKSFSENQDGSFTLGFMDPYCSGYLSSNPYYDYSFPGTLLYPAVDGQYPQTLARVHYKG